MRDANLAENESMFRAVNESVAVAADADTYDPETNRHAFLCECSNEECFERVWMTLEEYEGVRAEGRRFVVTPQHVDPSIETVVHETEAYAVVEKRGGAGVIAEELDPRP